MKKNGFTLIELLAVIVILAVLMIFAAPNVMKMIGTSESELTEQAIRELGDAALSYVNAEIFLKTCANGKEATDVNGTGLTTGCYKVMTVQDLIDKGYFVDSQKACNRSGKVIVYHYVYKNTSTGDDYNENRYYFDKSICNVQG